MNGVLDKVGMRLITFSPPNKLCIPKKPWSQLSLANTQGSKSHVPLIRR